MNNSKLDAAWWNERYVNQDTSWDIGYVAPALKGYFDQLPDKDLSILIPGCGNSYEAEYLLQQGFTHVTVIDISPLLTENLSKKFSEYLNRSLHIITGNFFDLQGQYDLIVEQTFFCALDPSLRTSYIEKMHSLLKPGGKLAGVMFNRSFEESPPFGGNRDEYLPLFEQRFRMKTMEPCYNSIERRSGSELFVIAVNQ